MKRLIHSFLIRLKLVFFGFLCCYLFATCRKIDDAYANRDLNEAVVSGIDSVYAVDPGETLIIKPSVSFTMDSQPDSSNYRYEWYFIRMVGFILNEEFTVISTSRTLNYKLPSPMGAYDLLFRVTDLRTNLFTDKPFRVYASNFIYEGWMLLCDDQGEARLDMLSFKAAENRYDYIPDVLEKAKTLRKPYGIPKFVRFCISGDSKFSFWEGGVIVGTDQSIYGYETSVLKYLGDVFDAYDIEKSDSIEKATLSGGYYLSYLSFKGEIHDILGPNANQFSNEIQQEDRSLRKLYASPFLATSLSSGYKPSVFFDEMKKELVWYIPGSSFAYPFVKGNLFNYKTGKNLLYLDYTQREGGQFVALLQDSISHDVFMARFTLSEQIVYGKIDATDIDQSTQFAINPISGKVYYGVENKLYEIDEQIMSSRLMKDFGENLISAMKFNTFIFLNYTITGTTASAERYEDLQNSLIVCTYDPARPDNSGRFSLYNVDAPDASFNELYSFDGLPKIVDVVYKER